MPDPGRQDGIPAGNRQPGSYVGKRCMAQGPVQQSLDNIFHPTPAAMFYRQPGKGFIQIISFQKRNIHCRQGRSRSGKFFILMQKTSIEYRGIGTCSHLCSKGTPLLDKNFSGQQCILHGIVDTIPHQLIIFDQTVVRIFREGQRREIEGINCRFFQELQKRSKLPKARDIVVQDIVPKNKGCRMAKGIKFLQLLR